MKRNILITVLVLMVPFLGGGLIGYGIGHNASGNGVASAETAGGENSFTEAQTVRDDAASRDSIGGTVNSGRRNAITRAVNIASPAVVGINVMELRQYRQWSPWGDDPFFRQFFGDRTVTQQVPSLGSGFIISADGYILTNDHVAGNAKEITVTVTGGQQFKAELVGTDLISDVALLKVNAKNLPYMRLGNSDDVMVGEWVIAMGNPFGLFDINDKPTVTVGVVSNTGMKLQSQDGRVYRGMIQTDAAINAGNSGGPLLNALGEVIGVNAVIYTPNQGNIGLGFAIPINRVKSIVAELRKHGKIERSFWTGLEIQAVDRRIARYFGLDKVEGVIVSEVQKKSPAERSGFRVGDIILAANGERVDDESSLLAAVEDAKAGDVLSLKVFREHKTIELKLPLEKRTQ